MTAVASSSVVWRTSTEPHPPSTLLAELEEFYFSTGGPYWFNNTGWASLESNDETMTGPCNSTTPWFGLNCTSGRILKIALDLNNLRGTLPSTFGASWELNLNLQSLSLTYNGLFGLIPPNIVTPKLSELFLSFNAFNGSLPSLDGGAALTRYFLNDNNLSGNLPNMSASTCPLLAFFFVGINNLTGNLDELCNLPEGGLIELSLEFNGFDGDLPPCLLQRNPQISWFILKENSISGSLSDSICSLGDALVYFDVSSNSLVGTLPVCLGSNTPNAQSWQLNSNYLSGSLPEAICESGNHLSRFELFENYFTGSIPSCYAVSFPELNTLLLHDNNLRGHLPAVWNLGALNSFTASNNVLLDGVLPESLFVSSNLINMVVEGTQIRGSIPSTICESSSLKILALGGNKLDGELIECLFKAPYLETVRLARNSFASVLPSSLGEMLALKTLDLSFNEFAGSLPASLGNLSKRGLAVFDLSSNHFSCDVPAQLVAWKNLSAGRVKILEGSNLFSCANVQTSAFSLTIPLDSNLASVDPNASSVWCADLASRALAMFTWTSIAVFFLILSLWVVIKHHSSNILAASRSIFAEVYSALSLRDVQTARLRSLDHCHHNVSQAIRSIIMLESSVSASACIALFLAWPLITEVATSPYECPSYGKYTLASKDLFLTDFSYGIGICVGATLFFGVLPWFVRTPGSYVDDLSKMNESSNMPASLLNDRRNMNIDMCKHANLSATKRLTIALKWIGVATFNILPNIAYVVVLTSVKMSSSTKELAAVLIVIFKSIAASSFTPFAARSLIDDMLPIGTFCSTDRFQARVVISMLISVLFGFIAPVVVVLATSPSCFYHSWISQFPPEATDISISFCTNQAWDEGGKCTKYGVDVVTSRYQPEFEYSGAECISTILYTYTPVYHAAVLMLATIPALLDVMCNEILIYCKNTPDFVCAKTALMLIVELSSIIDLTINSDSPAAKDNVAIEARVWRVIEKAYTKLFFILLIAMTFGLASPSTCGLCAFSAVVIMVHHLLLLKQFLDCDRKLILEETNFHLPRTSGFCLGLTVAAAWMLASVDYLSFMEVNIGLWGSLLLFAAILIVYRNTGLRMSGYCCRGSMEEKKSTNLSTLRNPLITDEADLDDEGTYCHGPIEEMKSTTLYTFHDFTLADETELDDEGTSGTNSSNKDGVGADSSNGKSS